MSDYTATEVESAIDDTEDGFFDLGYASNGSTETVTLRGEPVLVEKVDGKAPAEGGGEDISVVIKVGDQHFRKTGYYASHSGSDWDGTLTEVHAVTKTVTVYE